MPDNPTLSERLREAVRNDNDWQMSAWLRYNTAELLQALDDNALMADHVVHHKVCATCQAVSRSIAQNSRNEDEYIATITQLEKERAEAVERMDKAEKDLADRADLSNAERTTESGTY